MTDKEKSELTVVFSFRTSLSVAAKWNKKILRAGCNRSEFFRMAVEQNQTQVIAASPHPARAVFLLSKTSNNINQLAHRANSAYRAGKLTEATFSVLVDQLQQLNQFMINQAKEATK